MNEWRTDGRRNECRPMEAPAKTKRVLPGDDG